VEGFVCSKEAHTLSLLFLKRGFLLNNERRSSKCPLRYFEQQELRPVIWNNQFSKTYTHLNAVLLHGQGTVDAVQLVVEAACIAHWLTHRVASPQRRRVGMTVGAGQTHSSRRGLQLLAIQLLVLQHSPFTAKVKLPASIKTKL